MVLGKINKEIVSLINQPRRPRGRAAGKDGELIRARRMRMSSSERATSAARHRHGRRGGRRDPAVIDAPRQERFHSRHRAGRVAMTVRP